MAQFLGLNINRNTFPNFWNAGGRTANAITYASAEDLTERALINSHYAVIDVLDANGVKLWTSTIDTQDTLGAAFRAGTLIEILQDAFNG